LPCRHPAPLGRGGFAKKTIFCQTNPKLFNVYRGIFKNSKPIKAIPKPKKANSDPIKPIFDPLKAN
jgi:hypothetical protein